MAAVKLERACIAILVGALELAMQNSGAAARDGAIVGRVTFRGTPGPLTSIQPDRTCAPLVDGVQAWHETLGTSTAQVVVAARQPATVSFTFARR